MIAAPQDAWPGLGRGLWDYDGETLLTHCWADGDIWDEAEPDDPPIRCGQKADGGPLGLCAEHRKEILG